MLILFLLSAVWVRGRTPVLLAGEVPRSMVPSIIVGVVYTGETVFGRMGAVRVLLIFCVVPVLVCWLPGIFTMAQLGDGLAHPVR